MRDPAKAVMRTVTRCYDILETHFHIVPAVVEAALAEQAVRHGVPGIKSVQHRVSVFGQTCRKDDDFVEVAHPSKEVIHSGSLENVEVVPVVLYFNWYDVIWGRYRLPSGVSNYCSERDDAVTHP